MIEVQIEQKKLIEICKESDISFLAVFGSYTRGEAANDSDIDLLVKFSKPKTLLDFIEIEQRLSNLFGKKVDLLTNNSVSPYIKDNINKNLEVIYSE